MRQKGGRSRPRWTGVFFATALATLVAASPVLAQEHGNGAQTPPAGDPRGAGDQYLYPPDSQAAALPQLTPDPVPHSITAVMMYVSDMDRSLQFYTDLFELDVLGRRGAREVVLSFSGAPPQPMQPAGSAPQPLLIMVVGENSAPVSIRNPTIMVRVDMPDFIEKAAALGVQLDTVSDADGRPVTSFGRDPDGNWFQVYR